VKHHAVHGLDPVAPMRTLTEDQPQSELRATPITW
jgi:hypothetical protein